MFVLGCLFVVTVIALARADAPRRGVGIIDHSNADFSKRPPPPAPMRRAGIEVPFRKVV